tara:strand:+ start:3802 stop:4734 length:933 start_codon:yes stop_codon:yes gene_type:complete
MPKIDSPASPIVSQLKGLHLFHFDGAPCAQRVRFALGEKGLARGREDTFDAVTPQSLQGEDDRWVSRIVSLAKKEHISPAYAQIHPNMVVPALVHDGQLYLESLDIIAYLDNAFGGPRLIPQQSPLLNDTMALVEQAKQLHVSLRYVSFRWGLGRLAMLKPKERARLKELAGQGSDDENLVSFYGAYSTRTIPNSVFEEHLLQLYNAFEALDSQLSDGRLYLLGETLTIADVFWAMKLLRLIETGYPVAEHHPELYEWYLRMYARPAFQNEVMARNRMSYRFFRAKSGIENVMGLGLKQATARIRTSHRG